MSVIFYNSTGDYIENVKKNQIGRNMSSHGLQIESGVVLVVSHDQKIQFIQRGTLDTDFRALQNRYFTLKMTIWAK